MTADKLERANEISQRLIELDAAREGVAKRRFLSAWGKRRIPESVLDAGVVAMGLETARQIAVLKEEFRAL